MPALPPPLPQAPSRRSVSSLSPTPFASAPRSPSRACPHLLPSPPFHSAANNGTLPHAQAALARMTRPSTAQEGGGEEAAAASGRDTPWELLLLFLLSAFVVGGRRSELSVRQGALGPFSSPPAAGAASSVAEGAAGRPALLSKKAFSLHRHARRA